MRRRGSRFRVVAALVTAVVTMLGVTVTSAPASALTWPGQSTITYSMVSQTLQPTGDRLGVSVQLFDWDRVAVAFTGTMTLSSSLGGDSVTLPIASADGSEIDASASIAGMAPGSFLEPALVTASITATKVGEDVAWQYSSPITTLYQQQNGAGATVEAMEWMWWPISQDWGCERVRMAGFGGGGGRSCVVDHQTTGDETWQRGYKLTFNWTSPLASDGRPYQRCKLWFMLPDPNGSPVQPYSLGIDVLADWSSYTVPLPASVITSAITPGSTTADQRITCFDLGSGESSPAITQSGALVPDVPPTQPTTATATADGTDLDAVVGGSQALGVAQLQGYQTSLVDVSGSVVASAVVSPPALQAQSVHATKTKPGLASHVFADLKAGTYRLRVSSFNAVGASATTESAPIQVKAVAPVAVPVSIPVSAPRSLHAKVTRSKATLRWTVPAHAGSGIAKYRIEVSNGTHHVTRTVTAGHRTITLTKLHRGTRYTVRVTVTDRSGHIAAQSVSFRTKH